MQLCLNTKKESDGYGQPPAPLLVPISLLMLLLRKVWIRLHFQDLLGVPLTVAGHRQDPFIPIQRPERGMRHYVRAQIAARLQPVDGLGAIGQKMIERSGGSPSELTSLYVVAWYRTSSSRVLTRSDAALFVAGALGWPWNAARLIRFLPRRLRDGAYDVVARNRYRVFGQNERCLVPRPELRRRFIDSESPRSPSAAACPPGTCS